MQVDQWTQLEVDENFQGKGIGLKPIVATVERRLNWGYSFVEDPVMVEKNGSQYKRAWSGPRGPWNEAAGKSDPYDGPVFEAGTKVRVGLHIRGEYYNLNFIAAASPAESDDGDSGAYNMPGTGSKPPAARTDATTTEINIRLGMAFNNLTAMLAAPKASRDSVLDALDKQWGKNPIDVWVEWMAAAAEGRALPLVIPVSEEAEDKPAEQVEELGW